MLSCSLFGFEDFPEHEDRFLVIQTCITCHSLDLVSAQSLSRSGWNETITWMEENHNLVFESSETRDKILNYLAASFGERVRKIEETPMGPRVANPLPKT